jgi:hypothetical protein
MKQTKKKMVWLVAFLAIGSIPVFGKPFAKGPYLGQTPPGPIPKVFAPGLICHAGLRQYEAWGTFSADGNTFCFMRGTGVFITENSDQGWTAPEHIKSIPWNLWAPWSPCLSQDANSIFFNIGDRHPRIKHYGLFRCDRTSHGWSEPQRLGPPLSSAKKEIKEITCSLAANNNVYLTSGRKGGDGRCRIWFAPFVGNTWPRAVHISLNHPGGDPGIAPDESFMVFTSLNLPGGYGHRDLYLTLRLPDGTWSKPRNLGPRINTSFIEHGPRISPDKKYLFFNRSNGWDLRIDRVESDIYWVELKEYLPESYR